MKNRNAICVNNETDLWTRRWKPLKEILLRKSAPTR